MVPRDRYASSFSQAGLSTGETEATCTMQPDRRESPSDVARTTMPLRSAQPGMGSRFTFSSSASPTRSAVSDSSRSSRPATHATVPKFDTFGEWMAVEARRSTVSVGDALRSGMGLLGA